MNDNLDQLYQEVILEHNRKPRNFKVLPDATHHSHGHNPLCGDDYYIFLKLNGDTIEDIGFQGQGCAISKSSASMLTAAVKGKSREFADQLKDDFIDLVTKDALPDQKGRLKSLKIFEGVKKFPVRVKCAALAWRALEDALLDKEGEHKVTTE